jgi:DNA-binding beta-propeller fold protein YncE
MTPLSPTIPTQNGPTSAVVDAQGKFLYVTNTNSGTVSVFATDAASLTARSTANAGINPVALTLDATGRFAYVANVGLEQCVDLQRRCNKRRADARRHPGEHGNSTLMGGLFAATTNALAAAGNQAKNWRRHVAFCKRNDMRAHEKRTHVPFPV